MKKIVWQAVTLVALATLTNGCQKHSTANIDAATIASTGKSLEGLGVMSSDEYMKITQINDKLANGFSLNNDDATWLLSVAQRPTSDSYIHALRMTHATRPFRNSKREQWPADKREKIFDIGIEMVQFPYQSVSDPKKARSIRYAVEDGCNLLGNTYDPRAKPYIEALLKSPEPMIVREAKSAIAHRRIRY